MSSWPARLRPRCVSRVVCLGVVLLPLGVVGALATTAFGGFGTGPPVITIVGDPVLEATGPAGAPLTYAASVSDPGGGAPSLVCVPESGSVTIPVGGPPR